MSGCRYCPADIRWVVTVDGRPMPIDVEATVDGNIVLEGRPPKARILRKEETHDGPRFTAHFATCPNYPRSRRR